MARDARGGFQPRGDDHCPLPELLFQPGKKARQSACQLNSERPANWRFAEGALLVIRAVAFVPYPLGTTPSQRFRLEQWAPLLEGHAVSMTFRPFATPGLVRLLYQRGHNLRKVLNMGQTLMAQARQIPRAGDFDVAVVHRGISLVGPALLERRLAQRVPIVYDFDDAIHLLHTSDANRAFGWLKFPGKTSEICGLARSITVGNEYLAGFARQFNPDVTVVPSSVDAKVYTPGPEGRRGGPTVVGWMGSSTSQTYLEPFAPLLRRMVQQGLILRIISDRRPRDFDFPFEWKAWSAATEVEDLRGFDIGIMPLPDTEWARGKCAMKILQYMGVAVPSIGSDLGGNREVISDGVNGFLATSEDEWMEKILRLSRDEALARRLGEAGRDTVLARYSAEVCAQRFGEVLRRAAVPNVGAR
jgi:glycosyltransferase involved in cell wall biosynthesis